MIILLLSILLFIILLIMEDIDEEVILELDNYFNKKKRSRTKRDVNNEENSNKKKSKKNKLDASIIVNEENVKKLINIDCGELMDKNKLKESIEKVGIENIFQIIVRFRLTDVLDILLEHHKEELIKKNPTFILMIIYYDNLSLLKQLLTIKQINEEFTSNLMSEYIRFAAYTGSIKCLNDFLLIINVKCKFFIINGAIFIINYNVNDRLKGLHCIMYDIINIACGRGNINVLQEYIIKKENIQEELSKYIDDINMFSLNELIEYSNKKNNECVFKFNDQIFEYKKLSDDMLASILNMKNMSIRIHTTLLIKERLYLNIVTKMQGIDEEGVYLKRTSYKDCLLFYEENIKRVQETFEMISTCANSKNRECFDYLMDRYLPLSTNQLKIVNEFKQNFSIEQERENVINKLLKNETVERQILKILIHSKNIKSHLETLSKHVKKINNIKSNNNVEYF